jgi:hypothetical protein
MIHLVFVLGAILQTPLPTVEVKAPKDVAVVEVVNHAMSALSQKVTACVAAATLRTKYDGLITRRPEWKDQLLSYQYVDKQGRKLVNRLSLSHGPRLEERSPQKYQLNLIQRGWRAVRFSDGPASQTCLH